MILFLSHSGIKIYTLLFYVIVKLYDMFQGHIKCNKNKNGEAKYCESTVFLWIVYSYHVILLCNCCELIVYFVVFCFLDD